MNATRIAILYTAIATASSAVNLIVQMIVIALYHGPFAIQLSMIIGIGAALPPKYVLEKRWIFAFTANNLRHDGGLFLLYSFLGLFTTAIFWAIEQSFQIAFGTDAMRYVGGAIGLALGNYVKYQLDKRFVFVARAAA